MSERNFNNLEDAYQLIKQWGEGKGIIGNETASPTRQYLKFVEETGELAAGLARNDLAQIKDALGDVFVVWVMLNESLGTDPIEVVDEVYNIISKRKGVTKDGVFVKQEDLD